jgi:hypothetical protein
VKQLLAAMFAAGFFALVPAIRADEKNDSPKAEVKGTLMLEGMTYKLENGLAYETTKFDRKRTVVYLSDKPLETTKLKASFKKKGTDEDFFASGPHIRLIFDDKGELIQISLHARGANIILQGDPNIKAEAAIKDGVAKGTAKSVKPDKDYEFLATFDVKLTKP